MFKQNIIKVWKSLTWILNVSFETVKLNGASKLLRSFIFLWVKTIGAALVGTEGKEGIFWIHRPQMSLPDSQHTRTPCPVPLSLSPCTWGPRREADQCKNLCRCQLLLRHYQSRNQSRTQNKTAHRDEISEALPPEAEVCGSINHPGLGEIWWELVSKAMKDRKLCKPSLLYTEGWSGPDFENGKRQKISV